MLVKKIELGANMAGVDAGHPGAFTAISPENVNNLAGYTSIIFSSRLPPNATHLHNALGEQGLFAVPAASSDGSGIFTYGAASGDSTETLLAMLHDDSPSAALQNHVVMASDGDLFAMAAASGTQTSQLFELIFSKYSNILLHPIWVLQPPSQVLQPSNHIPQ